MTNIVSTDVGCHDDIDEIPLLRDDEEAMRELQLREIHHRIRNSLNLICCTLQLQALRSDNQEVRHALSATADRINGFARVHGLLERHDQHRRVDLVQYVENLVHDLQVTLLAPSDGRNLKLIHADLIQLGEDELTSLGSIVTELVTNAIKYGAGDIAIGVRRMPAHLDIVVEDEGGGFPSGFDLALNGGFGLRLVRHLCASTAGSMSIDRTVPYGKITASVGVRKADQLELSLSAPMPSKPKPSVR
ncbi:sensor histidine kinase [Paraburkholderia xenovorans]|uniref:sensor histidine kinase n=1 Tax=Paraburkholderia xenovorans TaxID=36873 RepID=UPI0015C5504C|nr:sensor histidine kinase [Paraburkholderia xenovorans]